MGAPLRAVPAHAEQDLDVEFREPVEHSAGILRSARRAQHRPALPMYIVHELIGQLDRRAALDRIQSPEAVADPEHAPDAVVPELPTNGADDVVQAGTQAAAGHDGRGRPGPHSTCPSRNTGGGCDRSFGCTLFPLSASQAGE